MTAFRWWRCDAAPGQSAGSSSTADLQIAVTTGDGACERGRVRPDSYVGARITTIVWKPDRARLSRAILLLPDMLPPDDFRRLRILLRYGRSEPTQGDPASHA